MDMQSVTRKKNIHGKKWKQEFMVLESGVLQRFSSFKQYQGYKKALVSNASVKKVR